MQTVADILRKYAVYEVARLTHGDAGDGTAYVLDRLAKRNTITPADVAALESVGARVSVRSYRYAPEIRETFVFVPDSVMPWACPDETCDGAQLERNGDAWTCPVCGCSTSYPNEDACTPCPELLVIGG